MKTCSYCGHVNEDAAAQCVECHTEFPVGEQLDPKAAESLVVLATFGDVAEASILKDRLQQAGIEACIPEELNPSPFGKYSETADVTVRVAEHDLEAAKVILSEASQPGEQQNLE